MTKHQTRVSQCNVDTWCECCAVKNMKKKKKWLARLNNAGKASVGSPPIPSCTQNEKPRDHDVKQQQLTQQNY